jgi:hypothetical protein
MNSSDWINIAICNKKRMMLDPERIYTLKDTCKHGRFLEVWQTTRAALRLAQTATINRNSTFTN